MLIPTLALVIAFAPQTTPTKPADSKPAASSASAVKSGSIDLTVTSQAGEHLSGATVRADGATMRQGTSTEDGEVVLTNVPAGTYRCRIEHDGFITLEKEIVVKIGARTAAEAVLSPAPPPPPPPVVAPPPPVAPPAPVLKPGDPVVTSLTDDLLTELMKSTAPVAQKVIGCSGATTARLVRVKDALPSSTLPDADEMIYIVAGDATLTLAGKDQPVTAGWLGIAPRGVAHALARRGRNPVVVLSIVSGAPCGNDTLASRR